MFTESVINTRSFTKGSQQALVLSLFDGLNDGESFLLVTDNDPAALCARLDSFQVQNLHWEYVKKAGDHWKVRIAKLDAKAMAMSEEGGCCGMCGGSGHD